jgi:hypothetical protein
MPTRRPAPHSLAAEARAKARERVLHARVLVRSKDFVDFCEVPELGDVNEQEVLLLDGQPILRGSPRRIAQVATQVAALVHAQEQCGRSARPVLQVEHVHVPASSDAPLRYTLRDEARLAQVLAFGGPTLTLVHAQGREYPPSSLPLHVAAHSELVLSLENAQDVDLTAELVLVLDLLANDPPA